MKLKESGLKGKGTQGTPFDVYFRPTVYDGMTGVAS